MGPDRSTALRGEPRGHKCVLWSAPIRLQSLRDVGHRFACHVNDVVLAGLAGALGRYLRAHGDLSKDLEIRMIIPVDLRPCQEEITLGNRFAVVFLRLPLDLENPAQRLIEIQRRTSRIKASQQAGAAFAILKLAGRAPGALEKLLVRLFARKATAVFTNLAGPRHDVFLANRRVCRIVPWVPQIGGIGLGISVFSYAGDVTLGITTDAGVIPDPEAILAGFQDEIAILIGSSRTAHAQS